MRKVTVHNLDDAVDFDSPFILDPDTWHNEHIIRSSQDVRATYRDSLDFPAGYGMVHAPSVHVDGRVDIYGDVHVTGEAAMDGAGWSFYSQGYTHAEVQLKSDPTMHSSESLGGRIARDMISEGGTFVVTTVEITCVTCTDPDGCRHRTDAVGWVVLRKDDDLLEDITELLQSLGTI